MKLRLKGNSIRVRLDRRDIEELVSNGRICDTLRFSAALAFSYSVEMGPAEPNRPFASYVAGNLLIRINPDDGKCWLTSDRVGFDHEQVVEGGVVHVLLEKDFVCLDRSAGDEADDAYAFPNPSAVCSVVVAQEPQVPSDKRR